MPQGRVFLDRDPKHFRLILNYLRDGEVCLPACALELQEILQEALFYQVCQQRIVSLQLKHAFLVCLELNRVIACSWMDSGWL